MHELTTLFTPDQPLIDIFIRGTVIYIALFFLLRLVHNRQTGGVGLGDLLVLVLIADASQNALSGRYYSIIDGLMLVVVIVFWSLVLDWLGFKSKTIQKFIRAKPLLIVKDGQLQRQNLRREFITYEELMTEVRAKGLNDISRIKEAFIEPDGRISIIEADQHVQTADKPKKSL